MDSPLRAYFGIYYREIDDQMAKEKGLDSPKGIYIEDLVEGGSAAKGGIKKGDIILQLGNSTVNRKSELTEFMGQHSPGDHVAVKIWRNGKMEEMTITLQSEESAQALVQGDQVIIHGATFEPLAEAEKRKFRLNYGFQVTHLNGGKLRDAGIREGFILLGIDREPIRSLTELKKALSGRSGGVLLEGLYPNGLKAYYGIGL